MKKAKPFITIFVFLLIFGACAEREKEFDITGTWNLEKTEIYIHGVLNETIRGTGEKLTFYPDGSGISGSFIFEWELTDDALFITEFGQRIKYEIKEKEKDKLILEDTEFEYDFGEVEILTLKR